MPNNSYIISMDDVTNHGTKYLETIFSLANGHFGIRASNILSPSQSAMTLVNGFYETSPIIYGEKAYGYAESNQTIVPLPDIRTIKISAKPGDLFTTTKVLAKALDMGTGQLVETWLAMNSVGQQISITLKSALSQPAGTAAAFVYTVDSINFTGTLHIQKQFGQIHKAEDSDDPRQARQISGLRTRESVADSNHQQLTISTSNTNQTLCMKQFSAEGLASDYSLTPNHSVSFTVVAEISPITSTNQEEETHNQNSLSANQIFSQSAEYWKSFWERSAISILGNDELNRAIHYNLFQLASSAGQDGKTNIAAKGLSGNGYEGHYFWDTEMYMLPFLTFTNPAIARSLIEYRASVLPQARRRARELGINHGALFAWRTINGEEASAYYPAGTAQYHIDADIAYAVNRYYMITDDKQFMRDIGLELLVETARFWADFGSFTNLKGKKRFEFFDVTGPDEYTAIVNNNYYTNRMAKFNLMRAYELTQKFNETAHNLKVTQSEADSWQEKAKLVYLPFDEQLQIHAQDDSALSKPVWPFESTPKEDYPLLLHFHPLDIYRHQVNKQADTLLADFLYEDISHEQLSRDYTYYENITTHDSSLSRSIFSSLAARLGDKDKAYQYFMDTARMDLIDMQGNASDGLHVANLGGSWISVAMGFGGISLRGETLIINNRLPEQWQQMSLRLQFHGRLLNIQYTPSTTVVSLLSGEPLTIVVDGHHQLIKKEGN